MADLIELNDDNFDSTIEELEVVLVDFYASWCGNCRMAAPMFKRVAEEVGVPLYKIDVEKNPQIKSMLSLEGLPTIGLFRKGEPQAAINTSKEEALREFLRENGIG